MNRTLLAACLTPWLLCIGCQAETRTYQVAVRNDTPTAVTVWLFKDGGPYENGWKSPEDIAIESPKANTPSGGVIVPSGKIATAGPILGKFDADTNAVLRVYRGAHSFNELLAIDSNSDARADVKLQRGANQFVVIDRRFKITLDRVNEFPATGP